MSNDWKKIRSWNVGSPDGSSEKYTLSKNKDGSFKIENDFGNISIEMERMSGYEFLKRAVEEMENEIGPVGQDLDEWMFSLGIDDPDVDSFDNCNDEQMD